MAALQYVHSKNVIHRDVKPENLVFASNGYAKLTDFGIAKTRRRDNAVETSGTPSYMAPEVIFRQPHGFEVDFYAVGVICHEMMLLRRPYNGRTRKELRAEMLAYRCEVDLDELPEGWDPEVVDFINSLLERRPHKRLGFSGASQVKRHPWLSCIDW